MPLEHAWQPHARQRCYNTAVELNHRQFLAEQVAPVSKGDVQSGCVLATAAVKAVSNRICGASWDVAETQVRSHLPSLPACPTSGQQPIQDLLEQPIPSHLQESLSCQSET